MRHLVLFAGFLILFASLSLPVKALDRGRQLQITDAAQSSALLGTVENAIWAADGKASDKVIYVIYSTECGWSQKLFNDTRHLSEQVQLRWIPVAARQAPAVVTDRTADAVAAAFSGKAGQVADGAKAQRAVQYNNAVMTSTTYQFRPYAQDRTFAFPTLIYKTAAGVKVIAGNPADLNAVVAEVQRQAGKSELTPAGLTMTANPVLLDKKKKLAPFGHNLPQPVKLYAAPSEQAAVVEELAQGFQMDVTGTVKDSDWLETQPWGPKGISAYIKAADYVRFSRLEFQVKRAGGNLVTKNTVQIRTHPDAQAPILDTLQPGFELSRSGEVELNGQIWDEVIVYTDGTKGYIAR